MTKVADTIIACLVAHAERVCIAILGPDAASVLISAYLSTDDLPGHVSATHEYMVVVDFSHSPKQLSELVKRFRSFLGKNVVARADSIPACLYWGEGTMLSGETFSPSPAPVTVPQGAPVVRAPYKPVVWLKSDTILPNWLDSILFNSMGARHEPDWQRYEQNLDLNEDEIKVYLGTYFPRSYAEAFCILDALFDHPAYSAIWKARTEASILDVGSGTGGNLIGILTALAKHCPHLTQVTIHGFDGNKLALDTAHALLTSYASRVSFTLDVILAEKRITSLDDLPTPIRYSYDFITSFKTGGEIISQGDGLSNDFYYRFLSKYADLLSDSGLIFILDVTTKPRNSAFLPLILNEQVTRFVREREKYVTIIPVPCHIYEAQCKGLCFTQKEFSVSHRSAKNDKSRVSYRVLMSATYAQVFRESTDLAAEYVIFANSPNDIYDVCRHSSGRGAPLDAYRIDS